MRMWFSYSLTLLKENIQLGTFLLDKDQSQVGIILKLLSQTNLEMKKSQQF
jgi:hypothetical protein